MRRTISSSRLGIEMKEARLRALTQLNLHSNFERSMDRNERRPFKGIDTLQGAIVQSEFHTIEMKEARLRALTHYFACC